MKIYVANHKRWPRFSRDIGHRFVPFFLAILEAKWKNEEDVDARHSPLMRKEINILTTTSECQCQIRV
jgi:hypothetical protein